MTKTKRLLEKQGFTLVELIIVIAIIAVLAVAAFMILTKWLGKSRDSRKLADIETASKSLMVWMNDLENKNGQVPIPDYQSEILFDGVYYFTQGKFGTGVIDNVDSIKKAPLNPSTNEFYTYSRTTDGKKYQIAAELEDGTKVEAFINSVSAGESVNVLRGNFTPGLYILEQDELYYAAYLPSIVVALETSPGTTIDIKESQPFVMDGNSSNLIDSKKYVKTYAESMENVEKPLELLWSGENTIALANPNTQKEIAEKLGGMVSGGTNFSSGDTGGLFNGGGFDPGPAPDFYCADRPEYSNTTFVDGVPTEFNQVRQSSNENAPCFYRCNTIKLYAPSCPTGYNYDSEYKSCIRYDTTNMTFTQCTARIIPKSVLGVKPTEIYNVAPGGKTTSISLETGVSRGRITGRKTFYVKFDNSCNVNYEARYGSNINLAPGGSWSNYQTVYNDSIPSCGAGYSENGGSCVLTNPLTEDVSCSGGTFDSENDVCKRTICQ